MLLFNALFIKERSTPMAYKIVRNHIVEQLEIEDNGKTITLNVNINVDDIIKRYNNANYAIASAQKALQAAANDRDIEQATEAMGDAILSLFEVIFGEDQTKQIIDIYDNRPLEMLGDIAPFIAEVINPRIQEAQQRIADRYKQVNKRGMGADFVRLK